MPKKDAFDDAKKDAEKARKKLNDTKKKDAAAAAAATAVSAASAAAADGAPKVKSANGLVSSNGTFAKAAAVAARVEQVEEEVAAEDYDYDEDAGETATASTSGPSKAKKPTAAELKKQANARKKDEFALLAEQEQLAKRQRIKDRFLRMLLVGVIMDFFGGGANGSNGHGSDRKKAPASSTKEKKVKKVVDSGESSFTGRNIKEKLDVYSGPLMAFVVVAAVLYGKAMEDTYSGSRSGEETNFYDIMGLPRDSSIMDVRKKYKSLALTWHPDKNPECEACPEKFAGISKAYETLSDVEAKKAYDKGRDAKQSQGTMVSVDLTAEDFEAKVLRSNEVWIVEAYDPNDSASSSFHPIWEECASNYGSFARFGRVDITAQKGALVHFPQRIKMTPVVFRFARGESTDNWLWQGTEEQGASGLTRWVTNSFPQMQQLETADELTRWWKQSHSSRLLISGKADVIRRGAQNKQFLQVLREAHMWADSFAVKVVDAKVSTEALKAFGMEMPEPDKKKGHPWSIAYIPAGETKEKAVIESTTDLKQLPSQIEEVVQRALATEAPYLTVRNHGQLCGAGKAARTFCLVLVDMPDSEQVGKVVRDVTTSRAEYAKELAEMRESEEGASSEEPFRIQAVRVMTGTSRFPSQPVAVSRTFYTAWDEVGRAPMFLMELETQRVSAVKASIVAGLYQSIAYEDQKFKELPEEFSLARAMPDPEVPLKRVLVQVFTTPFGALFGLVAVAAVAAVAPELELVTNAIAGGSLLAIIVVSWPLACRRCLSFVVGGV